MKIVWKTISVTAIAATVLVVGYRAAHADAVCTHQPNMNSALGSLRKARALLEHAEHDKGGWRARAIQSTDTAIRETDRGCAFENAH